MVDGKLTRPTDQNFQWMEGQDRLTPAVGKKEKKKKKKKKNNGNVKPPSRKSFSHGQLSLTCIALSDIYSSILNHTCHASLPLVTLKNHL